MNVRPFERLVEMLRQAGSPACRKNKEELA